MSSFPVVEHRESGAIGRLRRSRFRVALVIAAVEGLLVVVGAIPWWVAIGLAAVALVAYAAWGREHPSADVRTLTWVAAVSQLLVILVPVIAAVALFLAAVVIVLFAAAALVALLLDRR